MPTIHHTKEIKVAWEECPKPLLINGKLNRDKFPDLDWDAPVSPRPVALANESVACPSAPKLTKEQEEAQMEERLKAIQQVVPKADYPGAKTNHLNAIGEKKTLNPPKRDWGGGDWKPKKKKRTATAFRCSKCRQTFCRPSAVPCPEGWVCGYC